MVQQDFTGPWKCPEKVCFVSKSTLPLLKLHLKKCHAEKKFRYQCDMCDYIPAGNGKPSNLRIHKEAVHLGIKHICPQCAKEFTTKSNMQAHIKKDHEGRRVKCQYCEYAAKGTYELKMHNEIGHLGKRHNCDIKDCSFSSTNKNSIRVHRDMVHLEKTIPCLACDNKFSTEFILRKHIGKHHEGLFCEVCSFQILTKNEHIIHNNTEHDGLAYFCQRCSHKTWSKISLLTHTKKKHSISKPHIKRQSVCTEVYMTECDFIAPGNSSLNEHYQAVHLGIHIKCNICGINFSTKSALSHHVNNRHEIREIKHECKICKHKMSSLYELKLHMAKKHENMFVKCGECDFETRDNKYLVIHEQCHHDYRKWVSANKLQMTV